MIPIAQIKLPPAKSANRFTGERVTKKKENGLLENGLNYKILL